MGVYRWIKFPKLQIWFPTTPLPFLSLLSNIRTVTRCLETKSCTRPYLGRPVPPVTIMKSPMVKSDGFFTTFEPYLRYLPETIASSCRVQKCLKASSVKSTISLRDPPSSCSHWKPGNIRSTQVTTCVSEKYTGRVFRRCFVAVKDCCMLRKLVNT